MHHQGSFRLLSVILVIFLVLGLAAVVPHENASAATLPRVNKTADTNDGSCTEADCSLREAIAAAGTTATILFTPSLAGQTITLGSQLVIDKNLTIDNSDNSSRITISGGSAYRIFQVNNGKSLTLRNFNLGNGKPASSGDGGAILNEGGSVTIYDVYFYNNVATIGGAIRTNGGTITIFRADFFGNLSTSTGGKGGAIFNDAGTLIIHDSDFGYNQADFDGGAIYNYGTLEVNGSSFHNNQTILYKGGGIFSSGSATITNSTFLSNSAENGGGIFMHGGASLTLINSTLDSNTARLSDPKAAGAVYAFGPLTLRNSILSNSTASVDCYWNHSIGSPVVSNNLIEVNSAASSACGTPILTSDPVLDALLYNGGETPTMALLPGSPAINAGDNIRCADTDQRGVKRPYGSTCDIGAFEYTDPLVINSLTPSQKQINSGGFTLTVNGSGFHSTSVVVFNGEDLSTDRKSGSKLEAIVGGSFPEVDQIEVFVSTPGVGNKSNSAFFNVYSFADVLPTHPLWRYVEGFFAKGITTGCAVNPLRYCPDRGVTRAEMAVFILRAKDGLATPIPDPENVGIFADVPTTGKEWMKPWIEEFYGQGITTGCAVNPLKFCPERGITRAEMAVFLLRALNGPGTPTPSPAYVNTFVDVPTPGKEWMKPWIEYFYEKGYTTGCGGTPGVDLRYCPDRGANRAEMATFIDRIFGFGQLP